MKYFSEAYDKARDVIAHQPLAADWEEFRKKAKVLLAKDGPSAVHAGVLEDFRDKLEKGASGGFWDAVQNDKSLTKRGRVADEILAASKTGAAKVDERAATLKLLKHLYLTHVKGGQQVWVYSPPVAYSKWVYEEITGAEKDMKSHLEKEREVYSDADKKLMSDALMLARKWCLDAVAKLGSPSADTKAVVQRWFADEKTTAAQVLAAAAKLKAGLKKIANVCNSTLLIFSDEPVDRTGGGWHDYAFVNRTRDRLSVVYLQGAFLEAGRKRWPWSTPKLWMCALTIIHELSHREVKTDDIFSDEDGLKPSEFVFRYADALNNADSWGYFTTDLAGMLSKADRDKVWV
jgi:hypothetical protein